jgi:hypothetical protein
MATEVDFDAETSTTIDAIYDEARRLAPDGALNALALSIPRSKRVTVIFYPDEHVFRGEPVAILAALRSRRIGLNRLFTIS